MGKWEKIGISERKRSRYQGTGKPGEGSKDLEKAGKLPNVEKERFKKAGNIEAENPKRKADMFEMWNRKENQKETDLEVTIPSRSRDRTISKPDNLSVTRLSQDF